jgi:four helix bundle protein
MERLRFERLIVWRKALAFADRIYEITKAFPRAEMFGLVSQMRRAGVSVVANVAEGASRSSLIDQARFSEIAYGSLSEVTTMLYLARSQGFITSEGFEEVYLQALEVCKLLSGWRQSLRKRAQSERKQ